MGNTKGTKRMARLVRSYDGDIQLAKGLWQRRDDEGPSLKSLAIRIDAAERLRERRNGHS